MTRILVAEDDLALRRIICKTLSIHGYEWEEAVDGVDALEKIKASSFNLLLTDINMPNMSGLELCHLVRNQNIAPAMGIVVLTATGSEENYFHVLSKGADAWLAKPYQREVLLQTLERVLNRRKFLVQQYIMGDWMNFEMGSSLEVVSSVNEFVTLLLNNSPLDVDEVRQIGFAISEILMNAMEHGNHFDIGRKVRCSYVVFQEKLVVMIEDQGSGFLPQQVPDPTEDPLGVAMRRSEQGKRPGGYGLALSRKFMELTYSEKGNVALLTREFTNPGFPESFL